MSLYSFSRLLPRKLSLTLVSTACLNYTFTLTHARAAPAPTLWRSFSSSASTDSPATTFDKDAVIRAVQCTDVSEVGDTVRAHGVAVLSGAVSASDVSLLNARASELATAEHEADAVVFSTRNQHSTKTTPYFLQSGDRIRYFFEEEEPPASSSPKELPDPVLKCNKIGHALHDLDPVFKEFTYRPQFASLARQQLKLSKPTAVQSMFIFKGPYIGGEVVPHQDSSFIHTTPLSCYGFWVALSDATMENGCLWSIPGSHEQPPVTRFVRTANGDVEFNPPRPDPSTYNMAKAVPLECKAGSLVILHGSLVHFSYQNKSKHPRPAYAFHVVDGACQWSADNWLQRPPSMPFRQM